MIAPESFTKEWIKSFRRQEKYKRIDYALLEKMIRSFALIEKLARCEFEFVLKGGAGLALLLEKTNRFSVDADIIFPNKREELENFLEMIIADSNFTSWEMDKERSFINNIPKAHYIFTFDAYFNKSPANILLDVIYDSIPYHSVIEIDIVSPWIKTEKPLQKVIVPSIDAILGDKLTAFAPNTIGVPYQRNKELEIIKQLYDIGTLIDHISSLEEVYINNQAVSEKQFKYLGTDLTTNDVYEDICNTAMVFAKAFNNSGEDLDRFQELMRGISVFNHFLFNGYFRLPQAQAASAKAAYLVTKLQKNDFSPLIKYDTKADFTSMNIRNPDLGFIQRFKKTNKEAFFYWYQFIEMVK